MLREFMWNTFEKTGNIDSYVLFREIEEKDKAGRDKEVQVEKE